MAEQQQYRRPRVVCTESRLVPHRGTLGRAGETIRTRKYKYQTELMQGIEEEWSKIPLNRILTLIDVKVEALR